MRIKDFEFNLRELAGSMDDFVTDSTLLEEIWRGTLSEDLISLEGHPE